MRDNLIRLALIAISLVMSGCANPYVKYYTDLTNGDNSYMRSPNIVKSTPPRIVYAADADKGIRDLKENGFHAIGYSSFWAGDIDASKALKQAEELQASVVLYTKTYKSTESGYRPLTLPTTNTSSTSYSGDVNSNSTTKSSYTGNTYNTYGSGNYSGTATTTTTGTQTTYIPYTNVYYDYKVSYWIQQKEFRFGVEGKDLTDAQRSELGSNKGVNVDLVVKNTPAYDADILSNDIITKFNNDSVSNMQTMYKLLDKYEGNLIKVTLIRNNVEIIKEVKINKTNR